jgi:prevent-host-death family protein
MMRSINIHEAKTQFSKLIDRVIHGEEIIIAKSGKPAARLMPLLANKPKRFGILKGKIKIARDFDAPLPDSVISDFEGR